MAAKKMDDKLHALDPRFRKKVEDLFETIIDSFSSLYEVATHDEKTGLYNNKFFETLLDMEIEKAKRHKEKLSIIITDIDFFKKINDKYGHMKADELLKRLAEIILSLIRKSDIAARFGGEEFILLLPETSLPKAMGFAVRLRQAIHKDSVLKKHGLTVSGGITQYKEKDNKKKMKERVDKALYAAKNNGRDKFVAIK